MRAAYRAYQMMQPQFMNSSSAEGMLNLPSWQVSLKEPVAQLSFTPTQRPVPEKAEEVSEPAADLQYEVKRQSLEALAKGGKRRSLFSRFAY